MKDNMILSPCQILQKKEITYWLTENMWLLGCGPLLLMSLLLLSVIQSNYNVAQFIYFGNVMFLCACLATRAIKYIHAGRSTPCGPIMTAGYWPFLSHHVQAYTLLLFKHIINHCKSALWLALRHGYCRLDKSPVDRSTLCAKGFWTKYSHLCDWDQWDSWPAISQLQVQLIKMWTLAEKKTVTLCNHSALEVDVFSER